MKYSVTYRFSALSGMVPILAKFRRTSSIWCIYFGIGFLLFAFAGFSTDEVKAQPIGNEWLDYNQEYYKIPVGRDGIYRISYNDLQGIGFPVTTIDPQRLQVFHRGQEMAIFVEGQDDGQFNAQDYIEFYGQRNDGTLDERLYVPNEAQPHKYYNLYSDTTFYFLTYNINGQNGKRIQDFFEANTGNLPPEPFHWEKKLSILTNNYSVGLYYPLGSVTAESVNAHYDYGEGFTGPRIRKGQSQEYTFDSLDFRYETGPGPRLNILLAGRSNSDHNTLIEAGPQSVSLNSLGYREFQYGYNALFGDTLAWSDISPTGELFVKITEEGYVDSDFSNISVSYIEVDYPQLFNQNGLAYKKYILEENIGGKSYVEFSGITNPDILWDVTDPYNVINIGYDSVSGVIRAIIPNTSIKRALISSENRLVISGIQKIPLRRINASSANYLMLYHSDFTHTAGSYNNPVQAYAAYRASPEGGSFDTLSVEINTIFNQYSYGEYSPLAIRNFCRDMVSNGDPQYLLLIGKGLTPNYYYYRGQQTATEVKDWIPTAGYPGSDVLFTAGLNGSTYGPGIPTGRITAKSAAELVNYLEKIKEAELFDFDEMWKKDVIQLSGGTSAGELVGFRQFINEFKAIQEDLYLGSNTLNIYKESNNSVELINISEEINEGKSLILFFGHSAPNITDIDIGYVSDPAMGYNNKGKYPFMYINGCDAGNIFTPYMTFGEDWIITGQKGATGFFAHSDVGYTSTLKIFTSTFLGTAYGDSSYIDQSTGTILQETANRFLQIVPPSERNVAQVQQNVLQGDPAALLFGANRPDYSISNNDISIISIDDEPITTLTDSFDIAIIVKNFGRADEKPFFISIDRTLSDGTVYNLNPKLFNPVYYKDTLYFTINNNIDGAFGLNQFRITIDPFDSIPELRKMNNTVDFNYFLPKLGTQNLFPYNYSIVDISPEQLVAQATDILGDTRQFLFELDTIPGFNSPVRQNFSISQIGIAIWEADLFQNFSQADSTVFFWRSKFADVLPGEEDSWSTHSFLYIENGPEGWAQKSVHQLLENTYEGLTYEQAGDQWKFATYETSLQTTTYGANHPDKTYMDVTLLLNSIPYIYNTRYCTSNSINAIAFDEVTTNPYLVMRFGQYDILDRRSCGRQPQAINNFLNNEITGAQDYLRQYIDAVEPGDLVLIFSIGNVLFSSWTPEIKDKLLEIGASSTVLDNLNDGDPYIILGYKGAPEGNAIEITADASSGTPTDEQEINLSETIDGFATSGKMTSVKIGPSNTWYTFYNQVTGIDDLVNDQYSFQIIGVNQSNEETLLQSGIVIDNLDISGINPVLYPYLKLNFLTSDTSNITPAQLDSWIVTYEPMPEGILYPDAGQAIEDIQKDEGEQMEANFVFRNISDKNFSDSIKVVYSVFNQEGRFRRTDSLNLKALTAREEQKFPISFNTLDLGGANDLDLAANPNIIPERYFNNNYLYLENFVIVNRDNINPILDVAFDGRYILDGDIVAPSPLISVIVKDENEILRKTDTTGVEILIKPPCEECFFSRISFSDPAVNWTPATEKADFKVEYQPSPFEDGIYTLKVQASDASGNLSGTEPYQVRFEVINESQITNFYPYPNPFSTSTRFVFTLTGSVIPEQYKIQIMTISGKVVREIMQDEIGPIHIGNNITDYAWDGRDEYGDQLANGVYLYRVLLNSPEQEFKHRETSGDRGFTKGFGKMYLLR
jgi:hypothetical protein